jgi:hypothetical protein
LDRAGFDPCGCLLCHSIAIDRFGEDADDRIGSLQGIELRLFAPQHLVGCASLDKLFCRLARARPQPAVLVLERLLEIWAIETTIAGTSRILPEDCKYRASSPPKIDCSALSSDRCWSNFALAYESGDSCFCTVARVGSFEL